MIEEEREESELENTVLECCATISFSRMYANSLISFSSANLSMVKVFKIKQTVHTARLQSPKMYNFNMFTSGFTRKQEKRSGA